MSISKDRHEDNALKHNKGIIDIIPTYMMNLDEISFSYMAGLVKLKDLQPVGTANKVLLSTLIYGLTSVGVMPPLDTEDAPDLNKEDLLTLCGQLQRHSEYHKYIDSKREQFKDMARRLRRYIYENYQLVVKTSVKGRRAAKTVENAATD